MRRENLPNRPSSNDQIYIWSFEKVSAIYDVDVRIISTGKALGLNVVLSIRYTATESKGVDH